MSMRRVVRRRQGFSLLEMLAAVVLLGILAAIVIPRIGTQGWQAKRGACDVNRGNIEIQCQLWFRTKGSWPNANLSDIGSDVNYFPEGLPACPVDGGAYEFDSTAQQVQSHSH